VGGPRRHGERGDPAGADEGVDLPTGGHVGGLGE
jgi:hypothetical protein